MLKLVILEVIFLTFIESILFPVLGRTLSCSSGSTMQINPDLPEAHQVRGWYDNQVDATTVFQTYSAQGGFENGGGKNEVFKTIAQIKEENIGAGEKVIYFVLSFFHYFFKSRIILVSEAVLPLSRTRISHIQHVHPKDVIRKLLRTTLENGDVKNAIDLMMHLLKGIVFLSVWFILFFRYTLNISILDHTGQLWVSVFNDMGFKLFGKDANEMVRLKVLK